LKIVAILTIILAQDDEFREEEGLIVSDTIIKAFTRLLRLIRSFNINA
jgi:hypothetical protein